MSWEGELRDLVETSSGVKADWVRPTDNATYPFALIHLVSDPVRYLVNGDLELRRALVQIDIWAEDHDVALSIRKKVEADLLAFDTGSEINTIEVVSIRAGSSNDNDDNLFRQSMDIRVFYT